jgi:hypothetical protein
VSGTCTVAFIEVVDLVRRRQTNFSICLVVASASALAHDPKDYPVKLTDDTNKALPMQSYASLAKEMIAMGTDEAWHSKGVTMAVNEGKQIAGSPVASIRYLLPNLLASICSPLWRLLGKDWWP